MHTSSSQGVHFPRNRPASASCILHRRKSTGSDKCTHSGKLSFCTGVDCWFHAISILETSLTSKCYFSASALPFSIQTYLYTFNSTLQFMKVAKRSWLALLVILPIWSAVSFLNSCSSNTIYAWIFHVFEQAKHLFILINKIKTMSIYWSIRVHVLGVSVHNTHCLQISMLCCHLCPYSLLFWLHVLQREYGMC